MQKVVASHSHTTSFFFEIRFNYLTDLKSIKLPWLCQERRSLLDGAKHIQGRDNLPPKSRPKN
jgi:hypothetical protein